ncbi:alpha/beta hydrolase [Luteibacter sp. PPL201]|uniref:Alpha/beta hydrolase n=1 Tax=Luteibacter sahnii TaxID=3021977 RepID=A0ABT6BC72_9GAMM
MTLARRTALAALLFPATVLATTGSEPLDTLQRRPWRPDAPGIEIALWPAATHIASPAYPGPEVYGWSKTLIAGKPIQMVQHVSRPTMAIYPAKGVNTGTALLVFPGGGYRVLAIDLEGTEICDWATAAGMTCAVLKYRVPGSGPYWNDECQCRRDPPEPLALQDAQRAMGLLRQRAAQYGFSPGRVGVVGFSAGGRIVADISNRAARAYPPIDAADHLPSRPDFAVALYPGHLWDGGKNSIHLTVDVKIDAKGPPTFLAQAGDDATDDVRESLTYYLALQQAKVPVEMHLFPEGGHAFGVRPTDQPITHWTVLAEQWLRHLKMLPAASTQL